MNLNFSSSESSLVTSLSLLCLLVSFFWCRPCGLLAPLLFALLWLGVATCNTGSLLLQYICRAKEVSWFVSLLKCQNTGPRVPLIVVNLLSGGTFGKQGPKPPEIMRFPRKKTDHASLSYHINIFKIAVLRRSPGLLVLKSCGFQGQFFSWSHSFNWVGHFQYYP